MISPRPTCLIDIVNIFPPSALTEDQKDFYQPTAIARNGDKYELHDSLYERIKTSRGESHILVVGHGGCGKSTEFRMLTSKLRENGIPSVTIEATEDLDINSFSYIDVLILIAERLTQYAKEHELSVNSKVIAAITEALSTKATMKYKEQENAVEAGAEAGISLSWCLNFVSKIAYALKFSSGQRTEVRQEIDPKIREVINALNGLIFAINGSQNKIVIVIDGLEKCQSENAKKLFQDNSSSLASIKTHLIIACPINIYRSGIANTLESYFTNPATMRMIKTHQPGSVEQPDKEGIHVIRELILKRVDGSFFEEGVLEEIIKMAGGSLRNTCHLVRESAFEAHMREQDKVDMASAEKEMKKMATDLFQRIEVKYHDMLRIIFGGDHNPINDPDLSALLYAGVVFEYNGEGWVDLHPLLRHYLEENQGALREQRN